VEISDVRVCVRQIELCGPRMANVLLWRFVSFTTMQPLSVPYDVALAIVERIERTGRRPSSYPTLASFAIVSHSCAQASAKALYSGIVVRPSTDFIVGTPLSCPIYWF
jgi:hypothetical protein